MNTYFYQKTPLRVKKAGTEWGYTFVIFLLDKVMWETKAEGNGHKIKCPNLQPIDKYLRQAECKIPPGESQLS